jgi:hypothetical protein
MSILHLTALGIPMVIAYFEDDRYLVTYSCLKMRLLGAVWGKNILSLLFVRKRQNTYKILHLTIQHTYTNHTSSKTAYIHRSYL